MMQHGHFGVWRGLDTVATRVKKSCSCNAGLRYTIAILIWDLCYNLQFFIGPPLQSQFLRPVVRPLFFFWTPYVIAIYLGSKENLRSQRGSQKIVIALGGVPKTVRSHSGSLITAVSLGVPKQLWKHQDPKKNVVKLGVPKNCDRVRFLKKFEVTRGTKKMQHHVTNWEPMLD